MIRRSGLLASATLVAAFALSACQPVPSGDEVATVNGKKITEDDLRNYDGADGTSASAGGPESRGVLSSLILAKIYDSAVALSPADAQALYEQGPDVSHFVCLGVLDTADAATSQEAAAAINDGLSLADAVRKYSKLKGVQDVGGIVRGPSGLECVSPSDVGNSNLAVGVKALKGVPVGQAVSVDVQGTPVVFLLRPFDELDPAMQTTIAKSPNLPAALKHARVHVASNYGKWDAATATVVPLTE